MKLFIGPRLILTIFYFYTKKIRVLFSTVSLQSHIPSHIDSLGARSASASFNKIADRFLAATHLDDLRGTLRKSRGLKLHFQY